MPKDMPEEPENALNDNGTRDLIGEGKAFAISGQKTIDFTGKTIHPFCTHEGSGLSDTENDIRKAAHGAAVTKGLAIHGSHVDEAKSALAQWVEEFAK